MPLPKFPDVGIIKLPADIDIHKVANFLVMYEAHCQRILEAVIRGNFDELQNGVFYFWQSMPTHILPILHKHIIVKLIGVCDSILYKALAGALMPTVLHALSDSLYRMTLNFAQELESCLTKALWGLPDSLQRMKLELARRFTLTLRRQTSLSHLVQATLSVLTSPDIVSQLLTDWMNVDLSSIVRQTLYTVEHYTDRIHSLILDLCADFERLLDEQAQIESYLCWLENLVHCCVVKISQKRGQPLRGTARQFLLMWSCFGTRVVRDMTLQNAPSFGSFHLIHLMCDDYVFYLIESLHGDERVNELMKVLKGEIAPEDHVDDIILLDPTQAKDFFMSAWRSDQGHTRYKKTTDHVTGSFKSRENTCLEDDNLTNESSDDDEEDGELTDQESPGTSCDVMSSDVSASCMTTLTQSSRREHTLYPHTGHQQHQRLLQEPLQYMQQNYSSQDVLSPHSMTHVLHQESCLPISLQSSRSCDYTLPKHVQDSQSTWNFQARDMDTTVSETNFRIPSQHSSFLEDTIYQNPSGSTSLPVNAIPQFPQHIGKSCQQNLAAYSNVDYHGYMTVSQEVMSSFVNDSSSVKQKHESSAEEDVRFNHSHMIKRPRHHSVTGLQHCGMDLL